MNVWRLFSVSLLPVLAVALVAPPTAQAEDALRVCLDENVPPLSSKRGKESRGFDLAVAQAVAQRLGRTVSIQWFETEVDEDSNPAEQANALLSDGRCQLVAGFPLFASSIGEPRGERSKLPDYEGAKPEDRHRWVRLSKVEASRPYRFNPLAVVLGPSSDAREIRSLSDLKGLKLGAEEGTLADAILMAYGGGTLVQGITHVAPGQGLLDRLEKGDYDATLVELHRLDAYRALHPDTKLSSSGHYHSIGFNIGFLGRASEAALMAEVNAAVGEILAGNELPALAEAAGLTYVAPRQPDRLTTISRAQLRGD